MVAGAGVAQLMNKNIFIESKTIRKVEEAMTDLLICEIIGTKPNFVASITADLGLSNNWTVSSVRRSVHETSLGETDVEVTLKNGNSTMGLLIENKVRAVLMPDQLGRYQRRGQDGLSRGLWDSFVVVVFSPLSYKSAIPASDAVHVNGFVTYESVREWLIADDPVVHSFKIHLLEEAIADSRVGYVKKLDTRMTHFHQRVHAIAATEFPELKMAWLEQAGYDSSIIHLPHALPARGDSLVMKMKMGTAELRIDSRDPIGCERALSTAIPSLWRTTRAKSYAGVEVAIGIIDPTQEFDQIELSVRRFLACLRELHQFYHLRNVSELIEQNRGIRPSRSRGTTFV